MKYTYIKRNILGLYRSYAEPFDPQLNDNIGSTYEDYLNNKWVLLSDLLVAFHEANPNASVQEVWNMELTVESVYERTLEDAKIEKIMEIEEYDNSDAVNSFEIGSQSMWLTVAERLQIATQINANEAIGRDSMTRWFNGHEFTFPIATWKLMLVALEVYAGDALNVTEYHKTAVNALETIEEIDNYDITLDYPTKLIF